MAIAIFYAIRRASAAPWDRCSSAACSAPATSSLFLGYGIAAALMLVASLVAWFWGVAVLGGVDS